MTHPTPENVRYVPRDWLHPLTVSDLFFQQEAPLEVDVGSGKGRFLLTRAKAFPGVNFLGIERMLRRVRKTARKAARSGLINVRLLRIDARYGLRYLMPAGGVRCFYLFFPDPWPKKRHHHNRLLDAVTRDALHAALEEGGTVHVATDHAGYADEAAALFADDPRWEEAPVFVPAPEERTEFEALFPADTVRRFAYCKRGLSS